MEFKVEEGFVVEAKKEVKEGKNGKFDAFDIRIRENEFDEETLSSFEQLHFMKLSKEIPFSEIEKCKGKKVRVTGKTIKKYDRENNKTYTNYYIQDIQQLN